MAAEVLDHLGNLVKKNENGKGSGRSSRSTWQSDSTWNYGADWWSWTDRCWWSQSYLFWWIYLGNALHDCLQNTPIWVYAYFLYERTIEVGCAAFPIFQNFFKLPDALPILHLQTTCGVETSVVRINYYICNSTQGVSSSMYLLCSADMLS